jgi:hypothetical protein
MMGDYIDFWESIVEPSVGMQTQSHAETQEVFNWSMTLSYPPILPLCTDASPSAYWTFYCIPSDNGEPTLTICRAA